MSEKEIINRYFNRSRNCHSEVVVGVGDDAAVVSIPTGMELVLTMDTQVEGVHFLAETAPFDLGYKTVASGLSDLAAMGAKPHSILLSLTIPNSDPAWLEAFSDGIYAVADRFSVPLIGGDLCKGPTVFTLQAQGLVPVGSARLRSGAQVGDGIYVTGCLGGAGFELQRLQGMFPEFSEHSRGESSLFRPEPRINEGIYLREYASSMIDLSDGLVTDLEHILSQSGVGAVIELSCLPMFEALQGVSESVAWELALTSGEDYELCLTSTDGDMCEAFNKTHPTCGLTRIGYITETLGLVLCTPDARPFNLAKSGYQHF